MSDVNQRIIRRRHFLQQATLGIAGAGFTGSGCARRYSEMKIPSLKRGIMPVSDTSTVSFITNTDAREAAFQALKPLESEIVKAIGDKRVVIKPNLGQVDKKLWLQASDPNQIRGILDFLKPIHNREIIIAEGTAAQSSSTFIGYENYGYMQLEKEYNVKLIDLNDTSYTRHWIQDGYGHPQPVGLIDIFFDPSVYLISATRLKPSGGVIATLSLKNIVMASPIHHYKKDAAGRNEKQYMHAKNHMESNNRRGLSFNIFFVASKGIQPDLAVLDGTIAMEGKGPVNGTPVEHGIALASTDWLACDRLAAELMGIDYNADLKYLVWCGNAGMGNDNLANIRVEGPDYRPYIMKYEIGNYEKQRQWILDDLEARK